MSTGDPFFYLGAQGAYSLSDTATSSAQQNIANAASQMGMATYGGILGGNIWHQATTNTAGVATQFVTSASTLSEYIAKAQEPVKQAKRKLKGVLANLRAEVDGWHGDILDRCPA